MKKFLIGLFLVSGLSATTLRPPALITCEGKGASLIYSETSVVGKPLLTFDYGETHVALIGDTIKTDNGPTDVPKGYRYFVSAQFEDKDFTRLTFDVKYGTDFNTEVILFENNELERPEVVSMRCAVRFGYIRV